MAPRYTAEPLTEASHIFIVGLSRSGTTLARAVLNANDRIGIAAAESHFLGGGLGPDPINHEPRGPRGGSALIGTDDSLGRVLDLIYQAPSNRFWGRVASAVDRIKLEERLRSSDRTDRALFDMAMGYLASGRPIRGEKTPEHVFAVPTLLDWFPRARVVHMLRDPRAVYVSVRRKEPEWEARGRHRGLPGRVIRRLGPLGNAYLTTKLCREFRRVVKLHRQYQERYPDRYLLLQFEAFVGDPEPAVRRMCEFVGVPYSAAMLEQIVRNSSFSQVGGTGIDPSVAERWRRHLGWAWQRWFAFLAAREMSEFGYVP